MIYFFSEVICTFSDRLKQALKLRGMKQVDLCRAVGITSATVSQWVNGIRSPSGTSMQILSQVLHVSQLWLETGEGPMELPDAVEDYDRFAAAMEGQSDGKKEIVRLALSMPDELAEQLLRYLQEHVNH